MNILIVTQYFWPENFRINDLAVGLVEKGHDVTVLTGIPNYPQGCFFSGYGVFKNLRQDHYGVKIVRVPLIPRGKGSALQLMLNYFSYAFSASILIPFFCRDKYDAIFVCQLSPVTVGLPAIALKKLRRIPILFWIQDLWPESLSATGAVNSEFILGGVRRLVRFIYRFCDKVLIQSPAFQQLIASQGVGLERISYFPNSVESIYKPVVATSEFKESALLPVGFIVMFAGNIGAAQDFKTILAAAEILRGYDDIHWVILGDGRMRAWVEAEIENKALRMSVHMLGRHPMEEMPHYFSLADAMLVTLTADPIFALTIPAKIQSYLACGKPIIAGLNGEGSRVVLEADAGIACPAEDSEALAKSVLNLYKMPPEAREAMGRRGRDYCEKHFGRDILIARLELLLEELIHEAPQRV